MPFLRSRARWALGTILGLFLVLCLICVVKGLQYPRDRVWDALGVLSAVVILAGISVLRHQDTRSWSYPSDEA
jgi:hypothetical protein